MKTSTAFRSAGWVFGLMWLAGAGSAQDLVLPEAPSSFSSSASIVDGETTRSTVASRREKFIFPGQTGPQLTARDKVTMGLIHGISFYSATGWVAAAGYVQVLNGAPNYGTNLGAYGQRLGSAALRGYSEEVLGTSVLASLLHQDPRFYKMGPGHSVLRRTRYAVTRTFVTRSDAGGATANWSLLGGNLLGSALTNAYYPVRNRNAGQTFRTYGGSIGGAAFGFLADEFLPPKLLIRTIFGARNR